MKIAVLGSAGSSVGKAPFKDSRYDEWVQGRVQPLMRAHDAVLGDWDIWACSPGCWAVIPRATRFFELHRWETGVPWFSAEYIQFLRDFKGPVYTGGVVPEVKTHVVYPIDRMEEKFSSYFFTSSLALMMALAIDTIEQIRGARAMVKRARTESATENAPWLPVPENGYNPLPSYVDQSELDKPDSDDVIGLWGVDMAAADEYSFQRPGCQFFVLEAMRRGIGVYLPPESDLMRPMPVYGISEWDHNYIKLTSRARELSTVAAQMAAQLKEAEARLAGVQGEQHALNGFVSTWTSPYGMLPGMVIRQEPGTGLGSGITSFDGRPISRMGVAPEVPPPPAPHAPVMDALLSEALNYSGQAGGGMARVGIDNPIVPPGWREETPIPSFPTAWTGITHPDARNSSSEVSKSLDSSGTGDPNKGIRSSLPKIAPPGHPSIYVDGRSPST